jgi:hypothetical protein
MDPLLVLLCYMDQLMILHCCMDQLMALLCYVHQLMFLPAIHASSSSALLYGRTSQCFCTAVWASY